MAELNDEIGVKQESSALSAPMTRRGFLKLAGLAGAVAVLGGGVGGLLTACGDTTTTTSAAGATATSAAATTLTTAASGSPTSAAAAPSTTAAGTPKLGGVLKYLNNFSLGNPAGWPATPSSQEAQRGFTQEGLYRVDGEGNIIPWLAEEITQSDDLLSMTFKLRQGVKFHDGSDWNADVAKWNLDNCITEGSIANLVSVDVVDQYTIKANFDKWSNAVWLNLSGESYHAEMISKAAWEQHGGANGGKDWCTQNPVGTGPFKFVSYQQDSLQVMEKSPSYWLKDDAGQQLPYLDGVQMVYSAEPATSQAMMKAKQGDMTDFDIGVTAKTYEEMGLTLHVAAGSSIVLVPDSAHPDSPFSKKQVREAMEYAMDREALAEAFGYGYYPAAYQIPGPANTAYNPSFNLGRKFDVEKAKQLMSEAGYADGFKATLVIIPAPFDENLWTAAQGYLAAIGIELEFATFANIPAWIEAQGTLSSCLVTQPIQDKLVNYTVSVWDGLGGKPTNPNFDRTPELVKLVDASFAAPKPDPKLIAAVTDYLVQEACVLPLVHSGKGATAQDYVKNAGFGGRSFIVGIKPEQVFLDK